MSRGPGRTQRRIMLALYDERLFPAEIRREIGTKDRPNTHRSIRSLVDRGLVEKGADGRFQLTLRGQMVCYLSEEEQLDRQERREERRERREFEEALRGLRVAREEEARRREEKRELYPWWLRYDGEEPKRRRSPGSIQRRVLAVLWRYAKPVGAGLPVEVVKAIVAREKANTRRAIRSVFYAGRVDETPDGGRIRISSKELTEISECILPGGNLSLEHLDDDFAHAVLAAHGEDFEDFGGGSFFGPVVR